MLMAISRGKVLVEVPDVAFAIEFMMYLIEKLERAILPPTDEARVVRAIKGLLPATTSEIIIQLRPKYKASLVTATIGLLMNTNEITKQNNIWRNVVDKTPQTML
jgi:hypothetical protein